MKDAYAWWIREFLDGLRAEIEIPVNWTSARTILLFAKAAKTDRPKTGDQLYFEIPAGIEQIESLKTETHLFLFDTLPSHPWQALASAANADAKYKCKTLGAENKQGNLELQAQWCIKETPTPVLERVPGGILRLATAGGRQQVRAEVETPYLDALEYSFEREKVGWDPEFSGEGTLRPQSLPALEGDRQTSLEPVMDHFANAVMLKEARGGDRARHGWRLVKRLIPRSGPAFEKDAAALSLATPDSGSFIVVALRRRSLRNQKQ